MTLNVPEPLGADSTLKEAKHADVQICNAALEALYQTLGKAGTIASVCKVIDTTMKVTETRRKLLNLQYGAESNGGKESPYDPV